MLETSWKKEEIIPRGIYEYLKEKFIKMNDSNFESNPHQVYSLFREKVKKGYTDVSFGNGEWVDGLKIKNIYRFSNSDIPEFVIYEHIQTRSKSGEVVDLEPIETVYIDKELEEHIEKFKIKFYYKTNLNGLKLEFDILDKKQIFPGQLK